MEQPKLFQAVASAFRVHTNSVLLEFYWTFNEQL